MQVILNIGLDYFTPEGTRRHLAHWVTAAARLAWFKVLDAKLVQSDTEPTLVLTCDEPAEGLALVARIFDLSVTLKQDCIAAWQPDSKVGRLIGPKAADWGDFNPEFFFTPDGTRLG